MQSLKMPQPNFCLITSFAMVLDCTVEDLIEQVGHRGVRVFDGEWIFTGFHTQELIDRALDRGFAITKIQAFPRGQFGDFEFEPWTNEKAQKRFAYHMSQADGVILGIGMTDEAHASAWDHTEMFVHDPAGASFPSGGIRNFGFKEIQAFLRFDRIIPKECPSCGSE